jgi:hypothetical protein
LLTLFSKGMTLALVDAQAEIMSTLRHRIVFFIVLPLSLYGIKNWHACPRKKAGFQILLFVSSASQ